MANFQPQLNIWEANPKLKMLLLVLIFVFLGSGIGLVVFAQWSNSYRQQIYEQTRAGLPVHLSKQATSSSESIAVEPIDTSNWKNHTDNAIGVQIKIPTGWFLSTSHTFYITDDPGFEFLNSKDPLSEKAKFPIIYVTIIRYKDSSEAGGGTYEEYKLPNGLIAKKQLSGSSTQKLQYIDIAHNSYTYNITIYFEYDYASLNGKLFTDYKSYTPQEQRLVDAILAGFKFTK